MPVSTSAPSTDSRVERHSPIADVSRGNLMGINRFCISPGRPCGERHGRRLGPSSRARRRTGAPERFRGASFDRR